jgi:hypothetical protein
VTKIGKIIQIEMLDRPSEPIKESLRQLRQTWPGQPAFVYEYCDRLADNLAPIVNQGIYAAMIQTLAEAKLDYQKNRTIALHFPTIVSRCCDPELSESVNQFAKGIVKAINKIPATSLDDYDTDGRASTKTH